MRWRRQVGLVSAISSTQNARVPSLTGSGYLLVFKPTFRLGADNVEKTGFYDLIILLL